MSALPSAGGSTGSGLYLTIAGDEGGLAGVADAGAARPADGHVARFGEFEQAAVVAVPWDGEVAAGELDRGPVSGFAGGWVGRPRGCRCDAGRQTRCRAERFGVDARGVDPDRRQSGADLVHETGRPAQVCLGIAGWLEFGER